MRRGRKRKWDEFVREFGKQWQFFTAYMFACRAGITMTNAWQVLERLYKRGIVEKANKKEIPSTLLKANFGSRVWWRVKEKGGAYSSSSESP